MTKAITISNQSIDLMTLGQALANSGYFEDTREVAQAVVKILAGQEIGIGPIASMTGINIIKGKPAYSANVMAAVIKNHPVYDYRVVELSNTKCAIQFFAQTEKIGLSEFSIEDAKQAGLTTGKNAHSWNHFPRNMLFARAMSNGVKWFCPDATSGVPPYTPDEFDVEVNGETGEIVTLEVPPLKLSNGNNDYTPIKLLEYLNKIEKIRDFYTCQVELEEALKLLSEEFKGWPEPDNIEQWRKLFISLRDHALEIVNNQSPLGTFFTQAKIELDLSDTEITNILQDLGHKKLDPKKTDEYMVVLETQMAQPACDAALLAVVNREADEPYDHIGHIKNALKKAYPDFQFPRSDTDLEDWKAAHKLAVEYHTDTNVAPHLAGMELPSAKDRTYSE